MTTVNTHFLPATTGLDLGSPTQQWDLNAQDITLDSVTSNTLPHATTGVVNLGNVDKIDWRDNTNANDLALGVSGAAVGTRPADALTFPNAMSAPAFVSDATTPASVGQVRLGEADSLQFRNNAGLADINGVSLNATDEVLVGGANGTQTARLTSTAATAENVNPAAFIRMGNNQSALWRNASDLADYGIRASTADIAEMDFTNGIDLNGSNPLLSFGGRTAGTPMLKQNGSGIEFRLGDDSDFAPIAIKKITGINGISTTNNGVAVQVAARDLPGNTAATGSTTLYAIPAAGAGVYRLSWNAGITTGAATSSTLGPLTVVYTDQNSVAHTVTGAASLIAGTIATSSTTNTTAVVLLGMSLIMNCAASTNITFTFGYASVPANTMVYDLRIRLEYLS